MTTPPMFKDAVCRGSLKLGTGCGTCEKCQWEILMAGKTVEQAQHKQERTQAAELREQIANLNCTMVKLAESGLRVVLDVTERQARGDPFAIPILRADISKPL